MKAHHKMQSWIPLTSLALFAAALCCSCGRGGQKLTPTELAAFDAATPELKQRWAQAQAAGATNGYVPAILTLRSMLHQSLSKEQMRAVQDALAANDEKLMSAVNRGDAAAQTALETLRSPGAQLGR